MRSLRARLLLAVTLTFVGILVLLGLALDAAVRRAVIASFDASLLAKAKALSLTVEQHDDRMQFEFDPRDMPEFSVRKRPSYFEVWVNGKVFAKSESLGEGILEDAAPRGGPRSEARQLPNGRRGRAVVLRFVPRVDEDVPSGTPTVEAVIEVAEATGELEETLERVRWTIAALCAGAVVLAGVALVVVVGRSLRPLGRIADQIASLSVTELSARIGEEGGGWRVPSEVQPIVARLNELLGRLEGAFERERAFASDAAHELRTPVAALRTMIEVCLTRVREPGEYAGALERCLRVTASMQGVIENLLLLARAEAGQLPRVVEEVEVAGLAREVWAGFAERAEAARVVMAWSGPATCVVRADPENLRLVLVNLFDNVLSHGEVGGRVDAEIMESGGVVEFSLANTGCGLSPEEAGRVFERFWRKDAARAQTGVHAGLGLSLCQRLVALSGGTIGAEVEGGRFIVRIKMPASAG
jgi:signal transduction histidine kinase